jgi:two-component SAPR family response regulator
VFKPYSKQDLQDALKRAMIYKGRLKKRIRAVMFGSFDVYVDGKVMSFKSAKSKELFALLIQKRGGVVTPEEAMACLYEGQMYDKGKSSKLRMTVLRLKESLEDVGINDLLFSPKHGFGKYIDATKIECDLYEYLDGDPEGIRKFKGEYLTGYSWGELTLASLTWENGKTE